jgi:hypothetical protein
MADNHSTQTKKIVLTQGQQFTRLTVVESRVGPGNTYLCRCACGREKILQAKSLTRPGAGAIRSCGCLWNGLQSSGKELCCPFSAVYDNGLEPPLIEPSRQRSECPRR